MMESNIKHLKRLMPDVEFRDLINEELRGSREQIVTYNDIPGLLHGLYKDENVAIALSSNPKGMIVPAHSHIEHEYIGVICGSLSVVVNGDDLRVIGQYESVYIEPNKPHRIEFLEDSKLWVVTLPANPDFPEGEHCA